MPIEIKPTDATAMTRRQVLSNGTVGAAGLLTGCAGRGTAPVQVEDPERDRVLLLSDTHINADATTVSGGGVNMADRLDAVLARVHQQGVRRRRQDDETGTRRRVGAGWYHPPPGRFAVISGDAAHLDGQTGDYVILKQRLSPLSLSAVPVHITLGNHDNRDSFRAVVDDASDVMAAKHVRKLGVEDGSRFADWFLLDSLREVNEVPGALGEAQLDWLDRELSQDPDRPALIVVHHPPVPDEDPDKPFSLQDHEAFWQVAYFRDRVKAVFHGHTHRWNPHGRSGPSHPSPSGVHASAGKPLIGLPPTSYTFQDDAPWGYVVADLDASGMTLTLRAMDGHPADGETVRIDWA